MAEFNLESCIKNGVEKALSMPVYEGKSITEWAAIGMKAQRWISVKDRLPEKRGFYLVYCYMHSNKVVGFAPVLEDVDMFDFAGVKESGWYEYDGETGYYEFMGVTHWMPLPEPPKEVYT